MIKEYIVDSINLTDMTLISEGDILNITPNSAYLVPLKDGTTEHIRYVTDRNNVISKLKTFQGVSISNTSELNNDGQDGTNPFITALDIPDDKFIDFTYDTYQGLRVKPKPQYNGIDINKTTNGNVGLKITNKSTGSGAISTIQLSNSDSYETGGLFQYMGPNYFIPLYKNSCLLASFSTMNILSMGATSNGINFMTTGGAFTSATSKLRIAIDGKLFIGTAPMVDNTAVLLSRNSAGQIMSSTTPSLLPISTATQLALDKKQNKLVSIIRKTTDYSLTLDDSGSLIEMNVPIANTLIIPSNSLIPFDIGTKIDVIQYGIGRTSIIPSSGITIRSTNNWNKIGAQYGAVSLIKSNTNEWYLIGNLNA